MALHRPLAPTGGATLARPPEGCVPCAEASRPWVLAATIIASAMAFIDGSVVTIALPVLQAELGAGLAALQWVVNGYTLFLGALILVGGAAGDRFGRRRLFLIGTVALRRRLARLRAGAGRRRADRGAGGAGRRRGADGAAEPGDHRRRLPAGAARARDRHLGRARAPSPPRSGPAVGGFLIDSLGWRAAFWINLPLSVAVVLLALRARAGEPRRRRPGRSTGRARRWRCSPAALADPRADARSPSRAAACWLPLALVAAGLAGARRLRRGRAPRRGAAGAARPLRLARVLRRQPDDALSLRRAVGRAVPAALRADRPARHEREPRSGWCSCRSG